MRYTLRSLFAFMAVMGMMFGSISLASADIIGPFDVEGNVCPGYDDPNTLLLEGTAKINMEDLIDYETPTWEVTAPDGYLISGFCIKAGSAQQEEGPEFWQVDPAQKTVILSHSSEKDLSHYSLVFVPDEEEMGQWCSPGYWKQEQHFWAWPLALDTPFVDVFSYEPWGKDLTQRGNVQKEYSGATLFDVISQPNIFGGELTNLVADHLSTESTSVNFDGTNRYYGTDPVTGKMLNDCPLGNDPGTT